MGILYLIQPCELVGTSRFKIGCSSKNTLDRVKSGYKVGTRYLHICEVSKPFDIEKLIIDEFNKQFTVIAGAEYFEGDENTIKDLFIKTIQSARPNNNISIDDTDGVTVKMSAVELECPVQIWADKHILKDATNYDETSTDKEICKVFPKLHGNTRMITLENLYELYCKDTNDRMRVQLFNSKIKKVFGDAYDATKNTKLFGGQKKYIPGVRYVDDKKTPEEKAEDELVEKIMNASGKFPPSVFGMPCTSPLMSLIDSLKDNEKTNKVCLAIVQRNGMFLSKIRQEQRTPEICMAAMKQSRFASQCLSRIDLLSQEVAKFRMQQICNPQLYS